MNNLPGLFGGLDIPLSGIFSFYCKIGAGYQFQSTDITGEVTDSFSNGFPFAGGGVDFIYRMNNSIEIALTLQSLAQFENSNITSINQASLGINIKI